MVENLYFLAEQAAILVCLCGLYGRKFKLDILTMIMLVVNMILFNFRCQGYIGPAYSVLVSIVLFVYSLYEFKGNIKLTVVNNVLYVIIMMVFQILIGIPMIILRNVFSDDNVLLLTTNLIILLVIILVNNKFTYISKYVANNKWLTMLPIFICVFMLVSLLVTFRTYNYLKYEVGIISATFIVLVIALAYKWYETKAKVEMQTHELAMKTQELETTSAYSESFEKLVDDVRKRQHDIKSHISAIYGQHYTSKNYDEFISAQKEYCDHIMQEGKFNKLLTLKTTVLAGFLYSKFLEIEDNEISVEYNIELETEQLPIPLYEIITILGIFLDNAKEKVDSFGEENKVIKFSVFEDDKYIYFYVKNMNEYIKLNDLPKLFMNGYSSKGDNRGLGLNIVKEKAQEYDFDVFAENEKIGDNNWISFGIILKKV